MAEDDEIDITDGLLDELEIDIWVAGSERESIEITSGSVLFFGVTRICLLAITAGGSFSLSINDDSRLTRTAVDGVLLGADMEPAGFNTPFRFLGEAGSGCEEEGECMFPS